MLENEELSRLLRSCLQTLETKYKEVLELRYFQELSVAEISARLGLNPRRVSERLHYALKRMRKIYEKESDHPSILGFLWLLLA